jgi:hypothetical protein
MQEEINADADEQRHDERHRDADPQPGKFAPGRLTGRS